jgi:hypothetical protein
MGRAARIAKIFGQMAQHHAPSDGSFNGHDQPGHNRCVASERRRATSGFCSTTLSQYGASRLRTEKDRRIAQRNLPSLPSWQRDASGEHDIYAGLLAPSPIKSLPAPMSFGLGCPRLWEWNHLAFLVASGLRILFRFAGFCLRKLSIFFVVNVDNGTHNLLLPGSGTPHAIVSRRSLDTADSRRSQRVPRGCVNSIDLANGLRPLDLWARAPSNFVTLVSSGTPHSVDSVLWGT